MIRLNYVVAVTLLACPWAYGQEHNHANMGGAAKPTETSKPMDATAPKQRTCPVTGKAIREDVSVQQGGLKIYFSSPQALAKFKESPTQYLANVYKQIYPQSIQVKCLVSGDPLDPTKEVDFVGASIGFCCDMCPKDFKADPARFLVKMRASSTEQVHCPVTEGAIDPQVSTLYSGKKLYFSSADAMAKFKEAPAKYVEKLRPEAGVLARGATADDDLVLCVVAPPEKAVHDRKDVQGALYHGKTYFLASDEDAKLFKANPADYAKAVDEKMKAQPPDPTQWFTCSMDPDVLQKGPGTCPKCGMELTPVKSTGAKAAGHAGHAGHKGMMMGDQQGGDHAGMMMQGRGHGGMMRGRGGGGGGMMQGHSGGNGGGATQGQQDGSQGGMRHDSQNGGHPGCGPLGHDHQEP